MKRMLAALSLLAFLPLAAADEIKGFIVSADIGFVQGSETCIGCPGSLGFADNIDGSVYSTMNWVVGDNPMSSLSVMDLSPAQIPADNTPVAYTMVTHTNNVIRQQFDFEVDISGVWDIFLDDDENGVPDDATPVHSFMRSARLKFNETLNAAPCVILFGAPCADFWSVDSPLLAGKEVFEVGDWNYMATLDRAEFVNALEIDALTLAAAEGTEAGFKGTMAIAHVPEPSSLFLLLSGIGFFLWGGLRKVRNFASSESAA